ncbi:hypothetical protein [Actinomadura parmotrematis]|uniref:Uncharacterized protein n=1 Tax=Actinomadura parmotrematis TaxID=2864039 RepID=A0ABS7FV15_9ACTN|nr:hypothetical protein [Actinomadura parmotrematis]MBW8484171.1 hypothetical protein [Actinomadura parmotrematis]
MSQPGMRITVDAAMRARDVSRPRADGEAAPPPPPPAGEPARRAPSGRGKAAKNERRRAGKRGARPPQDG